MVVVWFRSLGSSISAHSFPYCICSGVRAACLFVFGLYSHSWFLHMVLPHAEGTHFCGFWSAKMRPLGERGKKLMFLSGSSEGTICFLAFLL